MAAGVARRDSSFRGTRLVQQEKQAAATAPAARGARRHWIRIEAAKRVSSGRNYVLSSTLVAEDGKEEQVMELCRSILKWGGERMADKKSGVRQFECNADPFEKNVYHFWERYESFMTMNDARASPEHCQFMNDVRPFLTRPVALAAYEYVDGQIGCMMNPIGPKGEGGLDDATGQGGSGGGASYKQTSPTMHQGIADRGDEGQGAWGMKRALEISAAKAAKSREAAVKTVERDLATAKSAAAKITEGFASIFGGKKKK